MEKLWTKILNLINNNLVKMYFAKGEFEGTLNSIGQRQNYLIKQMALSIEWSTFNRAEEGSRSKQTQVQIPEFSLSVVGYKFESVNLNHPHRHDRRRK